MALSTLNTIYPPYAEIISVSRSQPGESFSVAMFRVHHKSKPLSDHRVCFCSMLTGLANLCCNLPWKEERGQVAKDKEKIHAAF